MKTNTETTTVIFRVFKDGGGVIALMPLEPATRDGWMCDSYAHLGQHGAADPRLCSAGNTRLATPKEYRALAKELRRIGYRLKIAKRVPRNAYAVRKSKLSTK